MGKKSKDYPKEEKSGEVKRLKSHIRKLDKEVARLKSELKTYNAAFSKNIIFLKSKTKQFSVEELIEGAKAEMTLEEIGEERDYDFKAMEDKWKCFKCENNGVLKMIVVPGNRYFRKCNKCENRTEVKTLTEDTDLGV